MKVGDRAAAGLRDRWSWRSGSAESGAGGSFPMNVPRWTLGEPGSPRPFSRRARPKPARLPAFLRPEKRG